MNILLHFKNIQPLKTAKGSVQNVIELKREINNDVYINVLNN